MKINRHIHQTLRLKNGLQTVFILILFILIAWISQQYHSQIDLSANAANSLSETSVKVLKKLPGPIKIEVFIKEMLLKRQISQLLSHYQAVKKNISIEFIDPKTAIKQARKYNIGPLGAVVVEYQGRYEKITYIDESSLTNALLHLIGSSDRWITFLSGHGERSPLGRANFDLGLFGKELKKHHLKAQILNLARVASIPDNSSLLVLASPAVSLLPAEIHIISQYIEQGGNLLLLTDPDNPYLTEIENQLGIQQLPGTIVDNHAGLYGIDQPGFILTQQYSRHPITQGFKDIAVFPAAAAFQIDNETIFHSESLLHSSDSSWTETGDLTGEPDFNADSEERLGPLDFAFVLTRKLNHNKQQRIVVIGDGDFLSNVYLNNVGNLDLGLRIFNWLTKNDQYIDIPAKITYGKTLSLSSLTIAMIGLFFLLVLPTILLAAGLIIWRKRKRR